MKTLVDLAPTGICRRLAADWAIGRQIAEFQAPWLTFPVGGVVPPRDERPAVSMIEELEKMMETENG